MRGRKGWVRCEIGTNLRFERGEDEVSLLPPLGGRSLFRRSIGRDPGELLTERRVGRRAVHGAVSCTRAPGPRTGSVGTAAASRRAARGLSFLTVVGGDRLLKTKDRGTSAATGVFDLSEDFAAVISVRRRIRSSRCRQSWRSNLGRSVRAATVPRNQIARRKCGPDSLLRLFPTMYGRQSEARGRRAHGRSALSLRLERVGRLLCKIRAGIVRKVGTVLYVRCWAPARCKPTRTSQSLRSAPRMEKFARALLGDRWPVRTPAASAAPRVLRSKGCGGVRGRRLLAVDLVLLAAKPACRSRGTKAAVCGRLRGRMLGG